MQKIFLILPLIVTFGLTACATAPTTDTKTPAIKAPIKSKAVPQKPIKKVWVPGGWNESGVWVPGHWEAE